MEEQKEKEVKVDNDLYSRVIFTYGMKTMKKLSAMKILIIGMRGLGIETAKNIILNGPGEVDIYDPSPVKINDLGANFYLSESDVNKKNRDEACLEKLSKLNPYVNVSIFKVEQNTENYIESFCKKLDKYNIVVFTELHPMYFIDQVDKTCREKNIKLIYGICLGLAGYIFTDFGPKHEIFDQNGREIKTFLVKSITKDKKGIVTIDNIQGTNNLNTGDGDYVKFEKVEGMTELNDEKKDFKIRMIDYQTFEIGDTSQFGEYTKGGIVYEVKKPLIKNYFPFCQRAMIICDDYHPFNISDATKIGRSELLYMALSGVHDYYLQHNCHLPELNNMEQAKKIVDYVKIIYDNAKKNKLFCYKNIQEFDEKIVLNVARWSAASIQPICSFFGGIIAQEIIKATGKYLPIDQWFISDFFECVENLNDDKTDRTLKNCRYDDQIAIFGNEIQEKIQKSNLFMVGSGATGCEFLKNFAMMGFCTDKKSKFVVTDNDNIEMSNLSRQFLFNKNNVGQSKSITAAKTVKEMNPNFNVEGMQTKVCEETEKIFNERFWNKQNIVIYAVDSTEARKYIDNNVILYHKIGIDSGTKGTEAQSNIFIPYKTITYNDIAPDTTEKTLPLCTLRHFPSLIEHCIEWSRDSFGGYFGNIINDVKIFFENYDNFKKKVQREGSPIYQLDKLKLLKLHIDIVVNKDINKLCEYAIQCYTKNFDHNIQQLLISFPPDYKTIDGFDFWVGSKRLPHPISFNPDDDLCLTYISKFVFILSNALGINFTKEQLSQENIKNICKTIKIPEFKKKNIKIDIDEENKNKEPVKEIVDENSPEQKNAQKEIDNIFKELDGIKREKFDYKKINPEEFEKDHDENGHIDFIHSGAILRAKNYKIEECDRNNTKFISGKIIPTVLTTTASIAAFASIQLYTTFQTNDNKYFRTCYLNLNTNYFFLNQLMEPIKMQDKKGEYKVVPEGWNTWDFIEIRGPKTCGELGDFLREQYNIILDIIYVGDKMIYATFLETRSNINVKIEDAYQAITEKKIGENTSFLILNVSGTIPEATIEEETFNDLSALLPKIKYIFK